MQVHPFLVGLRSHHIRLLADCAMAKHFEAGEYLFRQGEFANRFYLVEQGKVVLEALDNAGTSVVIEEVGAGKLVGWSWLFPPYIWHFDARAVEPTVRSFSTARSCANIAPRMPVVDFQLFKRMSQVMVERLQSARARLLSIVSRAIRSISRSLDHLGMLQFCVVQSRDGKDSTLGQLRPRGSEGAHAHPRIEAIGRVLQRIGVDGNSATGRNVRRES